MTALPDKTVAHLRQILLWPVQLLPHDETQPADDYAKHLETGEAARLWSEVDDEFGDPAEFQERHYNEFVTFLPPVQRFLYGQGLGKAVHRSYGESPIRVMRRQDVVGARVTIEAGAEPLHLTIVHADLYFFYDVDVAILAVEWCIDDLPFAQAQDLVFRFGRAYPAYWEASGAAGHCPSKVEWLDASGDVLAVSDYERREKFLSFVCENRAAMVAAHWEFLMHPLVPHHGDAKGPIRFRQLEYYRMPCMTYLSMRDGSGELTRADLACLALGTQTSAEDSLPYGERYLAGFEADYCYERYRTRGTDGVERGPRFLCSGHALVVIGEETDPFFASDQGGLLGRFRHQHFLLFLIAHFQKAAIRMFSDRLVASVSRLDLADAEANRTFRREVRGAMEKFLRFAHRYWMHEISNQGQVRELFEMTRGHLRLDSLYSEVREELQDMANFLDVEAMRRQNETVVRLTVVTTFGLIGALSTGLLGMNLISWADEATPWRIGAFLAVIVPVALLTLYTVIKSRRLSEFLDSLSDEAATASDRWGAFKRIWVVPRRVPPRL